MFETRNSAVQLKSHVLTALRGWYFGRRPVLLSSYLIADGIHLKDTAKSSAVEGEKWGRRIEGNRGILKRQKLEAPKSYYLS